MKKYYKAMINRTIFVSVCFFSLLLISSGNTQTTNTVLNINGVRSLEAIHIESKYSNKDQILTVMPVNNMEEASVYGPTTPISFTGQMTAYKANCVGCTGKVSCPPRQDVRNGNIYFQDVTYGTVRILAADPRIPCGTIVQITNVSFSVDPIFGIVLDRGSAIKGNIMDFLVAEVDSTDIVGRQREVHYEVIRWGW